jgi:CrcB protein
MTALAMSVAAAAGALARFWLAGWVQRRTGSTRPLGTAAVNLIGAFLAGVVAGAAGHLGTDAARVAGLGFLGSFTTFSTWMVEAVALADDAAGAGRSAAMVDLGGSLVAGVALAAAGYALGQWW